MRINSSYSLVIFWIMIPQLCVGRHSQPSSDQTANHFAILAW